MTTPVDPSAARRAHQALLAGDTVAAIRHCARFLLAAPEMAEALGIPGLLRLARRRYLRARRTGSPPRIAVCGWELAHNAAGRVHALAELHAGWGEVAIIGSLFPAWGRKVWSPIRSCAFPLHTFLVEDESRFLEQAVEQVLAHPRDVAHLSKPRLPNLLFGALYRLFWGARVLMDVDDEELAFVGAETPLSLDAWTRDRGGPPPLRDLVGVEWTRLAVGLAGAFDGLTVANEALRARYGGVIVRHARDEHRFQPSPARRRAARDRLGLAPGLRVVLFLGTPRAHKGLIETGEALARLGRPDVLLLLVGDFPEEQRELRERLLAIPGLALRLLGDQPFERIPELLAAADLTVLLQDPDSLAARFQTPAKLGDALAMGLTVLATPVPGLADLAAEGAFVPVTPATLDEALRQALDAPPEPPAPAPVFTRRLSLAANRPALAGLLDSARDSAPTPALRAFVTAVLPTLAGLLED